jgi:hypothetical protein
MRSAPPARCESVARKREARELRSTLERASGAATGQEAYRTPIGMMIPVCEEVPLALMSNG